MDAGHHACVVARLHDGRASSNAAAPSLFPGKVEREREIGRADVHGVDAVDLNDGVEVAQRLGRFDHRDDGDIVSSPLDIVVVAEFGDGRAEASAPPWGA